MPQAELFVLEPIVPKDMLYWTRFLSPQDEALLLGQVAALPLEEAQYKQYTARRRTLAFGSKYDFSSNELDTAAPIPEFLLPLRERVAAAAGIEAGRFADALVTEYRPGTPLGWHRDVPEFETVAGVSLASPCRMRFRRYPPVPRSRDTIDVALEPRSLYVLRGEARWAWQHSIAPTPALRYSITFRTRR